MDGRAVTGNDSGKTDLIKSYKVMESHVQPHPEAIESGPKYIIFILTFCVSINVLEE